ncbi:DDE-type integrase/transposase/recombinase [Paenibacillus beijingensis]|uniref:Integrase catalytic domain-containing protein n=1 Tax=Paenibacillus beijingensis TaxID=1126833 RepID=A0A0D5NMW5_9BACL|nr:DDE-type integrase/transposase/recombinase [Paenibacillus beijingensis]AJY76263.1 hypothetical protein VN24_18980 [Paenibacillus beijingensis]
MMNPEQFEVWYIKNQITDKGKKKIESIRNSQPVRRVKSGKKNVSGIYPSRKMGVSIQFESHKLELSFIYLAEHDPKVIEFFDQPSFVELDYIGTIRGGKKKRKVFQYTPDFFTIEESSAGWVECKTEEELQKLSLADPERYCKDENGYWRCPPGEEYAKAYNLKFYVFCSDQIDWVLLRNLKFLEAYFEHHAHANNDSIAKLISIVEQEPAILLQDLLERAEELAITSDSVYSMIAAGSLYVDLKKYVLAEPLYTHVFTDAEKAAAYVYFTSSNNDCVANEISSVELEIGKSVVWDGRDWEIINTGNTMITIRSAKNVIDLTYDQFESYVKQGKLKGINQSILSHPEVHEAFLKASKEECRKANERFQIIQPYLEGQIVEKPTVPSRTIRYWLSKYRLYDQIYGNGFIALLPKDHEKGNRTKRLLFETQDLMAKWIEAHYETFKQKKIAEVYGDFLLECNAKGIKGCSYKTFVKAVRLRPTHEQTKKRQGEKAAYRFESYYLEYHLSTVRHGDRPFEIGHIDHTELEIELIDSHTKKNLGRPWATFLTDGCTRKFLAIYVSFDPPSYRSCMMVLRECVKRWSRLPETVVVDGGKEFSSVYFETVLSAFKSAKKQRPASKARFGSVCERIFGMTNTRFIDNLTGNTQITKNVRQITKKNNPKKLAIWTYGKFTERLKQFVYEVYDQMSHPALGGQSPQEAYLLSMKRCGDRPWMMIPYNETFRILTLPTSDKGTAKVEPGKGFKNNYIYYWSDAFRNPEVEGMQVPIRYEPYNLGIAYAYVNKRWTQCISDYYAVFNGKTEKQIQIATKELKKKFQNHTQQFKINIKILADFLRDCDSDELLLQQMKDQEVHQNVKVIPGGKESKNNNMQDYVKKVTIDFDVEAEFDIQERYGEF